MAVAVRRELRQADGARFEALLRYYQLRGGPGLALAQKEQAERAARKTHNWIYNQPHNKAQP
ncbi:MAG: hypothetical protein ACRYFZ_00685 [Janthinobacterium lividum]